MPAVRKARLSRRPLLEFLIVFGLFALNGAWPVPDVNEPHYLAKARHAWDGQWLAGDLFLEAPPAHLGFHLTFGWLSLWMPLETFAWCGRLATWLLQAWGWTALGRSFTRRWWAAPISAGLFVLLNERGHLAGEWVVGGLEAKGVAYALVFFAIAALVRRRWGRAWLLAGGASAFHVLVGGWTAIAAAATWLTLERRPASLKRMALPLVLGGALGACGLVPALTMNWGADEANVAAAHTIYVFQRLPHHLVPASFPTPHVVRFLLLVAAWVAIVSLTPAGPRRRRLRVMVGAALAIALVGTIIGLATAHDRELAASLLRYYWFRLADVLVPMGLALEIVAVAASHLRAHSVAVRWALAGLTLLVVMHPVALVAERFQSGRPRADRVVNYADWRRACRWIHDTTPVDSRFLTPRRAQTFKWYAQRSEVVTWKDIPQDAESIVRWWRRLEEIHATRDPQATSRWVGSLAEIGSERLTLLAKEYDADYVLTIAEPRLALPRVYQNNSYAVYRIEPDGGPSGHE